jgi:hypothetical protein
VPRKRKRPSRPTHAKHPRTIHFTLEESRWLQGPGRHREGFAAAVRQAIEDARTFFGLPPTSLERLQGEAGRRGLEWRLYVQYLLKKRAKALIEKNGERSRKAKPPRKRDRKFPRSLKRKSFHRESARQPEEMVDGLHQPIPAREGHSPPRRAIERGPRDSVPRHPRPMGENSFWRPAPSGTATSTLVDERSLAFSGPCRTTPSLACAGRSPRGQTDAWRFTLDLRLPTRGAPLALSTPGWVGDGYTNLGGPAPSATKRWWRRFQGWLKKNATVVGRTGHWGDEPARGLEAFVFAAAMEAIRRNRLQPGDSFGLSWRRL